MATMNEKQAATEQESALKQLRERLQKLNVELSHFDDARVLTNIHKDIRLASAELRLFEGSAGAPAGTESDTDPEAERECGAWRPPRCSISSTS